MSNERRQSTNVISVRFSDEELERVKAASELTGTPLSALIRRAALDGGARQGGVFMQTSPNTLAGQSIQATYMAGRFDVPSPVGAKAVTATYIGGQLLQR